MIKKGKLVYKKFSPNEALVVSVDSTVDMVENPVVQCQRFGISKRDSATLFSLFSFSDV